MNIPTFTIHICHKEYSKNTYKLQIRFLRNNKTQKYKYVDFYDFEEKSVYKDFNRHFFNKAEKQSLINGINDILSYLEQYKIDVNCLPNFLKNQILFL